VQVNGKLRGRIEVGVDVGRQEVEALARNEAGEWLQGKELRKVIYVEKKLINFVV
jgi:leucyl-tRNA synthetase